MIFVIVWFLNHFILEYVLSMNSIWIITPASLLHVWVTKFKTSLIFFKLYILTSSNVILVGLLVIIFDEAQHVVKISTTGYVSLFYEVINLFIKPQNFLLMSLYLIVTVCDGLLMFFLYFVSKPLPNMRKQHIATMLSKCFCSWLLTSKIQFVHTLLIDVNIVFLRILWPIDWCVCNWHTTHLIPLGIIFRADMSFYDISDLGGLALSQRPTGLLGTCPGFFIDDHKA